MWHEPGIRVVFAGVTSCNATLNIYTCFFLALFPYHAHVMGVLSLRGDSGITYCILFIEFMVLTYPCKLKCVFWGLIGDHMGNESMPLGVSRRLFHTRMIPALH